MQARGALVVVLGVTRDDGLEIGGGGLEIVQRDCGQRATVQGIDRVLRLRDHPIETVARPRELPVVEIQIAELLIVADRRIVDNGGFQGLDPFTAREDLKRAAKQAGVGNDLDENVGERTEPPEHEDDPEPVRVRPAAHEVHDGKELQHHAVRIEEPEHTGARL